MSLKGCFGCLKFLVFIVNFLLWLSGLGVMVCLWLLFDQHLYLQIIGAEQTDYYVGTYILLAIGGIMTLVGFLGCCGAWKESTWMLGTFFMCLVIIILFELFLGVLIYSQKVESPHHAVIKNSVESTVRKKYHKNATATAQNFDLIQEGLECCGANGPLDWSRSVFNGFIENPTPEIGIPQRRNQMDGDSPALREFNIPQSCCKQPETQECLLAIKFVKYRKVPTGKIHTKGCSEALLEFVDQHVLMYLLAIGASVIVMQIIGMLFSFCLCCALRKIEDFKA